MSEALRACSANALYNGVRGVTPSTITHYSLLITHLNNNLAELNYCLTLYINVGYNI